METIKLWKIIENKPQSIHRTSLDLESRLEQWLKEDISIVSDKLVVIGTQVRTDYNKIIDVLAINQSGELIIIELKRGQTYREVVAQGIDYATWVRDLDYEDINQIFNQYSSGDTELSEYLLEKFDREIEEFNSDHKILIVGSEIDDSTKRIIEYLSGEPYNVNINALSFNYFKDDADQEFLAQSFILPESQITEESINKQRKRKSSITKILFEHNKLKIDDQLFFKPARDKNKFNSNDYTIVIVNQNTHCARLINSQDSQCYSLSRLRYMIADKLQLKDVKKNWGFGVRYDWITEDGKSLENLRQEIYSD